MSWERFVPPSLRPPEQPEARLVPTCACGRRQVIAAPINRIRLAVEAAGWQLATAGEETHRRDTCPGCRKEELS